MSQELEFDMWIECWYFSVLEFESDCNSDINTDNVDSKSPLNAGYVSDIDCVSDSVQIPLEFVSDILSRLPIKEAIRYQSVCKSWRDEISSRNFIKVQANHNSGSYILLYSSDKRLFPCECFYLDFSSTQEVEEKKLTPLPRIPKKLLFVDCSCNGLLCFEDYKFNITLSDI